MKNLFILLALAITMVACNNSVTTEVAAAPTVDLSKYPAALQKVFAKHGSLATWKNMKALSYEIVKEGGNEKQAIDLHNRRERIEAANFKTGYDGTNFWVEADTSYKGNPVFYHNLMFYFYAMPFVLADDGIIYGDAAPLEYEGKSYPGIRISYNDGVGVSSQDEYFIHYDQTTYEMAWVGYTVTYFSGEKSKKISWIRYDDWKTMNGLSLPNSLTWFKVDEGKLIEPRNTRKFVDIKVSETALADAVFAKTAGAKIVE